MRVIKLATGTADLLRRLQQVSSGAVNNHRFRRQCSAEAKLLKGDSYFALQRYSEALDCYTEVVPSVLRLPDMSGRVTTTMLTAAASGDGLPKGATSATTSALAHVDSRQAEALYKCAVCLQRKGDFVAGFREATLLLLCRPTFVRGGHHEDPDVRIEVWHSKAYKLLEELKQQQGTDTTTAVVAAAATTWKSAEHGQLYESQLLGK